MSDQSYISVPAQRAAVAGRNTTGIPGAIARSVRRSYTGRERRVLLSANVEQLRSDRARAIAQRDEATREAQHLRDELEAARRELATRRRSGR